MIEGRTHRRSAPVLPLRARAEAATTRGPSSAALPPGVTGERGQVEPPNDALDHVRGPADEHLILEYGDYECPYSRRAYRVIQAIEAVVPVRYAFRHFPRSKIHPRAAAAAVAAEAAAEQDRFWDMHDALFDHWHALNDDYLRDYAQDLGLDMERFERDRLRSHVRNRVYRDIRSGLASGVVKATPTIFVDGILHASGYDAAELLAALGV
jgi:protein-disulfide isomerase